MVLQGITPLLVEFVADPGSPALCTVFWYHFRNPLELAEKTGHSTAKIDHYLSVTSRIIPVSDLYGCRIVFCMD